MENGLNEIERPDLSKEELDSIIPESLGGAGISEDIIAFFERDIKEHFRSFIKKP